MFSVNRNKYLLFISMIFTAVMFILFASGCSATVAQGEAAMARQDGATDKVYEMSPSSLTPANQPPRVTITALADGSTFTERTAVTFDAGLTALDNANITDLNNMTVLVGAGDIAGCGSQKDLETALLLDNIPGTVFTLGDNVYPDGADLEFSDCYDPTWGRHKARTRPAPGNHDYHTSGASGYFNYFGAAAGDADKGYYSYDVGDWHVIALNSECAEVGGCEMGSPQGQWLQADLAANPKACTLAYWHHPRFSSGWHGSNASYQDFWQLLYDAGADVVLNGHDHTYERFAPQDPTGISDPGRGIREFVVGTGGAGLYSFGIPEPNSEVRENSTHGVLKLTLHPTSYDWELVPIAGQTFTDSGSASCVVASSNSINVPGDAPTIQAGIDLASDGEVVLVAPGEYHETLELSGKSITLASWFYATQNASYIDQTIIDGDGNTVITVNSSVGPETKIIGFTIQNGNDGIGASAKLDILHNRFTGNLDAIDYEAGGGICRYNVFENNSDDAIDLDGSTEAIIENNIIRNNGDDGIEIRLHTYSGPTLNIVIRRNIISGSGEDGIQLIDSADLSDRVFLIERNLIKDSAMVGLGLMDNEETIEDFRAASIPERIHLFNNTFVDNDHGLTGGDNLIALNNIFVGSTNMALKNVDGGSIAAYNLFWGNGIDTQNSNVDTATTILEDPRLDGNYRPIPGSPPIDAGTAFFTWNSEIVLDLQPGAYAGVAPDLGAYEDYRLFLPFILKSVGSSATFAHDDAVCLREIRAIDTNDFGLLNPAGLAFSFGANLLG
jgi:hypothetical protein